MHIERREFSGIPEKRCSGCRICEVVCSLFHEGVVDLKRSRIKVIRHLAEPNEILVCKYCGSVTTPSPCMTACAHDAIYRQTDGRVQVDNEICTGCPEHSIAPCMAACPFNSIRVDPVKNKAINCDLCGGDPICVKYCPSQVLFLYDSKEITCQKGV